MEKKIELILKKDIIIFKNYLWNKFMLHFCDFFIYV